MKHFTSTNLVFAPLNLSACLFSMDCNILRIEKIVITLLFASYYLKFAEPNKQTPSWLERSHVILQRRGLLVFQ